MRGRRRQIHRLVEEQAKKWLFERMKAERPSVQPRPYRPVIAISRQRGSVGSTIAGNVAGALGFPFFYSDIEKELTRRMGVDQSIDESSCERLHSRNRELAQCLF